MNKYINKFKKLIKKSGLFLFILRLPVRITKNILIRLNSFFWKILLKECGKNVIIELGVNFENPKNIIIENNVYIGSNSTFGTELDTGSLILEDNVHIGRNCKIDHTGDIRIKRNTLLSANTTILSHSHGYNPRSKPKGLNLIIDENCWIGLNSIIIENCNYLAKNTIVATGSIITKDIIEDKTIIGGVPAKKIKNY